MTKTGYQLIVVAPASGDFLKQFDQAFGPFPYPIYGDPTKYLYREMGHQSMPKWKLLMQAGIGFIKNGKKAFMPDNTRQRELVKTAMKSQDIYIQGGTWIFNEKGKVIWSHIDTEPEKHASIHDLLTIIKK